MKDARGRKREKPYNSYGKQLENLLEERRLSLSDVVTILRAQKGFADLNRTTLYRWCVDAEEKVPSRAHVAWGILRDIQKINAPKEVVHAWIERMQDLDEKLRVMRKGVQEIVAQITFYQQ